MSYAEAWLFWLIAPLMVLGAFGLLFARKAVHAALCMAFVMVNLGVLYLASQAEFLGIVQVFVYTGAVMMIFLFVLMLIGVDASDSLTETIRGHRVASLVVALALAVVMFVAVGSFTVGEPAGLDGVNADPGNVSGLADLIFGKYVWVFEITSALLITAAVGAMVLAHRERLTPKSSQRELAARRVKDNVFVAGLPAPGVYARSNAVDTPALLPDGTPSALSVSRVLVAREQIVAPDETPTIHASAEIEEGRSR
jgi:NADH-quinone oxidoreductase subunit J